jgi:REP element-mobilizing transposase RayT
VYYDTSKVFSFICNRFFERENAIAIARANGKSRNFSGENFWARGYAVSTVGFELEAVKNISVNKKIRMSRVGFDFRF